MGDLTSNFSTYEFVFSDTAREYIESNNGIYQPPQLTAIQHVLVEFLAKTMQIIRDNFDKKITIKSGVRDILCVEALKAKKYHVSSRTDHSFGNPKVYAWGVGAADWRMEDTPSEKVMKFIHEIWLNASIPRFNYNTWTRIGQCILYYGEHSFIHLANPKNFVYQQHISRYIKKKQFLQTADGVKFEPYDPKQFS